MSHNKCNLLEIISKWGYDGTQQTQYKQKFENTMESDANIFQSSLVALPFTITLRNRQQKNCLTKSHTILFPILSTDQNNFCSPLNEK